LIPLLAAVESIDGDLPDCTDLQLATVSGPHSNKSCLVLDRGKYRYQEFISDIVGQDISAHGDEPERAIKAVRDWLAVSKAGFVRPPGGAAISKRLSKFMRELPAICAKAELQLDELTFVEYADMASTWLKRELGGTA
jgi:hypothetical protein